VFLYNSFMTPRYGVMVWKLVSIFIFVLVETFEVNVVCIDRTVPTLQLTSFFLKLDDTIDHLRDGEEALVVRELFTDVREFIYLFMRVFVVMEPTLVQVKVTDKADGLLQLTKCFFFFPLFFVQMQTAM
jgi:hypothetical protein